MLFVSIVIITTMEAKEKKDPIVMTVAGKEIPLSEFIYIAKKDNSADLKDKKSLENYIELFKNYKLKVADAESYNVHKLPKFERDLKSYKLQLQESFLVDKTGEEEVMRAMYERTKIIPGFKQIFFRLPGGKLLPKDTVATYQNAMDAYNRIINGESFESVGESLMNESNGGVVYIFVEHVFPLRMTKELEDLAFNMEPGEISQPVRSPGGFHIVKSERKIPNPGNVRVAHILSAFPSSNPTAEEKEETLRRSDSIYQRAIAGDDFAELAIKHSSDTINGRNGGIMPYFGIGEMIESFEEASFGLENVGDISKPVETRYGFHVIKLIDYVKEFSFEEMAGYFYETMMNSNRKYELYSVFDEKMKARHNYKFFPEAYEELQQLANEYYPEDTTFYYLGIEMENTLVSFKDSIIFPQYVFADYVGKRIAATSKTLSTDIIQEMFDLFLREIVTEIEREMIEESFPEYKMLVQEYYDGVLLFEVSNKRIWMYPAEQHDNLEAEWIKELKLKYPVVVNKKVVKNIKKYLN